MLLKPARLSLLSMSCTPHQAARSALLHFASILLDNADDDAVAAERQQDVLLSGKYRCASDFNMDVQLAERLYLDPGF